FDVGAGHIDANAAVDPGLVYESGFVDHVAYLCGLDPLLIGSADCELLAKAGLSSQPSALNLPSIGLSALVSGDVLTRRVTNVGPPATYRAVVDQPLGLTITVEPASLSLATGQTAEYGVRFERSGAPLDVWSFGRLRWTDDEREVGSPIAV